jgi:NADH-quinone oxidoreductase subunit G
MPILYIDNKPYEVKGGKNLLETCLTLGLDLPYFCWHPALGSVGACRQCAVKSFKDENDTKGRIVMSCMEPVTDKQRISISDNEAVEFRSNVVEWLMTNHPHDCAVCDEGGSCHLQDMTVMTGHNYRRFQYKKRTHTNQYLGPFINHEMNRCIQCYRCVRFYRDYAGGDDLNVFASKSNVYFGRAEDGCLENEFSGNLSEVCPTGVFTDKTLKEHYTRKWDLTTAPSVCQHCSLGCNIIAGERYGELRVIMNRYHGDVNGYFICDRGRFGYDFVNRRDRIQRPIVAGAYVDRSKLISEVVSVLKNSKKVIGIGSPRASIQSNFALKSLVGADNFYHGVSDNEHDIAELAIEILRGPTPSATIKEVENADAVLVLGEDLTNTAPRLALAVRQAGKNKFAPEVAKTGIPSWHDAATREIIQDQKGSVFIATVSKTKLDDVSSIRYLAAPEDISRFGLAIASKLNPTLPPIKLDPKDEEKVARIATALRNAKNPVIISGSSCEDLNVTKAAANVAWALTATNPNARISLTMPECNSLGLAMMGGHRLESAIDAVMNDHADTVIVMENDLYRHGSQSVINTMLAKCKTLVVVDHLNHKTAQKAHIVIPAGTFAESDGIIVNNEGRAQRYYQVYESTDVIQESWRWILAIAEAVPNLEMTQWKNFEDITKAISNSENHLSGVSDVNPSPGFRIAGQRIPRQPHRYSGRTAMLAHHNVSEPKPPEDPDSPMSYTMEGLRALPPSSMIPFYWAPGWNSVQSVNKYQEEVGASLRGGDPGKRLLNPVTSQPDYYKAVPEPFRSMEGHLWVVPLHHIFGSEELSVLAESVSSRIPTPYMMINTDYAKSIEVLENQVLAFTIEENEYHLPVKLSDDFPHGVAGVPAGFSELRFTALPAWALLKMKSADRKEKVTTHGD